MTAHGSWIVVVPQMADGRIILQHAASSVGARWTLPTGTVQPGENLEQAANRLLHRTTDYVAGRFRFLGRIYGDRPLACYLAADLRPAPLPPMSGPLTSPVALAELRRLVACGAPCDCLLLSALALLDADAAQIPARR